MTQAHSQSSWTIRSREYSHQVLVPTDSVRGRTFDHVLDFHEKIGVPIKNYTVRKDDDWYLSYCFTERNKAVAFQMLFGGKLFDQTSRELDR
jgi:hypothetical protein